MSVLRIPPLVGARVIVPASVFFRLVIDYPTVATTAMMSEIWVVIAVISPSKQQAWRRPGAPGQAIVSGAGRVIGCVAGDIAVAICACWLASGDTIGAWNDNGLAA